MAGAGLPAAVTTDLDPHPEGASPRLAFVASDRPEAQDARAALIARYGAVAEEQADVIVALGGDGVVRLPDPDPADPERPAGATWWPPVMLDPEWARTADFDVFRLRYSSVDSLAGAVAELADNAVVISPPELADAVVERLRASEERPTDGD